MKAKIIIAALVAFFAVFSPVALNTDGVNTKAEQSVKEEKVKDDASGELEISDGTGVTVKVFDGDDVLEMELETYITGVVAGEMPVSFEEEALKAQAVAARTYTLYRMWKEPAAEHEGDVCTDAACCKAFADEEALRAKWGEDFDKNMAKIRLSVWETEGIYMVYENEPVLAVFHSSSSGATENSGNVWNRNVPYLVSVASPEGEENVANYISTEEISYEAFEEIFTKEYPDARFSADKEGWITDIVYSESGRINTLCVGGVKIRGTQLRKIFGLRSTSVEIKFTETGLFFTVTGYGHGVGMSQYGANTMAQNGSGWREILCWYYSGIEFSTLEYTV